MKKGKEKKVNIPNKFSGPARDIWPGPGKNAPGPDSQKPRLKITGPGFSFLITKSHTDCKILCKQPLSASDVDRFKERIADKYRVHLLADNLPSATRMEFDQARFPIISILCYETMLFLKKCL